MKSWAILVVFSCVLTGCDREEAREEDAGAPQVAETFGKPDTDGYVLINGTCRDGVPVSNVDEYVAKYEAKANSLGYVRIRSSARFDADDLSNLMGTVPCGTIFRGNQGVKNPSLGNAAGYYVLVRDSEGNKARGYVSWTVVEWVSE